jgi:hypothetical protein
VFAYALAAWALLRNLLAFQLARAEMVVRGEGRAASAAGAAPHSAAPAAVRVLTVGVVAAVVVLVLLLVLGAAASTAWQFTAQEEALVEAALAAAGARAPLRRRSAPSAPLGTGKKRAGGPALPARAGAPPLAVSGNPLHARGGAPAPASALTQALARASLRSLEARGIIVGASGAVHYPTPPKGKRARAAYVAPWTPEEEAMAAHLSKLVAAGALPPLLSAEAEELLPARAPPPGDALPEKRRPPLHPALRAGGVPCAACVTEGGATLFLDGPGGPALEQGWQRFDLAEEAWYVCVEPPYYTEAPPPPRWEPPYAPLPGAEVPVPHAPRINPQDRFVVGEAGERHYYDPQSGEVMLAGWRAVTDGVDHWYGHANHRGSSWVAPLLHPAASPGSVFRRAAEGGGSA